MGGIDTSGTSPAGPSVTSTDRLSRFLTRLILFGLVYLTVRSVIEWFTPFHIGSDHFSSKLRMIEGEKEPPSVFFIGSSRTHYHFNPALFDSVVSRGGGGPVRSFNLSQGATTDFESVRIARNLLKSSLAPACKTIFIEFNFKKPEVEWDGDEKSDERYYHRMNPSMFVFHAGAILRADGWGFVEKARGLYSLARVIGLKYFGVGRFRSRLMGTYAYREMELTEVKGRGFESMDSQFARNPALMKKVRETLDTSLFRIKAEKIRNGNGLKDGSSPPIFDSYFDDFMRETEKKGVRVFYVVQPNVTNGLISHPFSGRLSDRVIDMTDPDLFPEFYDWANYFDNLHLNASGSDMITTRLAVIYLEKTGLAR